MLILALAKPPPKMNGHLYIGGVRLIMGNYGSSVSLQYQVQDGGSSQLNSS